MGRVDLSHVCERIAKLESDNKNQTTKINEIHKALIGNGQPGLLAEWNQWKDGMKLFSIIISTLITILGVIVGFMAYMD